VFFLNDRGEDAGFPNSVVRRVLKLLLSFPKPSYPSVNDWIFGSVFSMETPTPIRFLPVKIGMYGPANGTMVPSGP